MAMLDASQVREEARRSKELIESNLDREVTSFSYPYGMRRDENPTTARILAECGYRAVFLSQHGTVEQGTDVLRIPRIKVEAGEPLWMFKLLCQGGMDPWRLVDRLV
jgi:peptidoglycan/xylan/chitin deacetylase (PgdA/CDA1 family)